LKALMEYEALIDSMFNHLVKQLSEALPRFGKHLAMDSKAVASFAKRKNKNETRDGRRDTNADYGRKDYRGVHEDGMLWEKIVKWFGDKLHLIVDRSSISATCRRTKTRRVYWRAKQMWFMTTREPYAVFVRKPEYSVKWRAADLKKTGTR